MQGTHEYEIVPVFDPNTPTTALADYLQRIDCALADIAHGRKPLVNDIRHQLRILRGEMAQALVFRPWVGALCEIQAADAGERYHQA